MNDRNKTQPNQENEGEGNRTAARKFNQEEQKFAQSGKVGQAAREAEEALDSGAAKELAEAEAIGKRHAADEDPEVKQR
jgi:hypothetical protein